MPRRRFFVLVATLGLASGVLGPGTVARAAEPFTPEDSPAPLDESLLYDVDVDLDGRMVAVGKVREYAVGGSPFYPLVIVKDRPEDPWTVLDAPDFGWTWHELRAVRFIPGSGGDFVAVGEYLPDPYLGDADGMLLRYRRAQGTWDLRPFAAPGAVFHSIRDAALDPEDPNRLLIVGLSGISDAGGSCFQFRTMTVDYRLDTHSYDVLPTTVGGGLWGVTPLPNGNFLAVGIAAAECDYVPYPVVLEVEQGTEIVHPNPPPHTAGFWYSMSAVTALRDGRVFMVGIESPHGGVDANTLAYRYDLAARVYEPFKPLDPDTTANHLNQFWDLGESPAGRIYAIGRTTYRFDGFYYRSAMIQSFDGSAWELHPIPDAFFLGMWSELWGLAVRPDGRVYAAGFFDAAGSYDEKTLVLRNEGATDVAEPAGPVAGGRLELLGPNPFRTDSRVGFRLSESGPVRLEVFDLAGRSIRVLVDGLLAAGPRTVRWDGADDRGSPAPSGWYFYRLSTREGTGAAKVLRLR